MSRLAADLATVARDLEELGAAWALVGGLAVSTWCDPRLTRDIGVVVSVPGDQDAERLVLALQQRGYAVTETIEQEATVGLPRRDSPVVTGIRSSSTSSSLPRESSRRSPRPRV